MIDTPATRNCAAHNAAGKPCGNMALTGALYCRVHLPQDGEEGPEAEIEEELDAESRLTYTATRVSDHVAEATTVAEVGNRMLSAFDVLVQITGERIDDARGAIETMVSGLVDEREALRRDVAFLLAAYNLAEEQRGLLEAAAVQAGQSMDELLSDIISERLTWDEDCIAVLVPKDVSLRVREVAHFRGANPGDIVEQALRYCWQNEAL